MPCLNDPVQTDLNLNCADNSTVLNYFKQNNLQLLYVENYLDITTPSDIIKDYIQNNNFISYDPNYY